MVDGLKPERDDDTEVTALDMASGFRGVQTDSVCSADFSSWRDFI